MRMTKYARYKYEKERLEERVLTPQEYAAAIKALCERLKL